MRGSSLVLLPHSLVLSWGGLRLARAAANAVWARSHSSLSFVLNAPDTATEFSVILPPGTVLSCQSTHWNPAMGSPEDGAASSTPEACGSVY